MLALANLDVPYWCNCPLEATESLKEEIEHYGKGEDAFWAAMPAEYRILMKMFCYEPCEHVLEIVGRVRDIEEGEEEEDRGQNVLRLFRGIQGIIRELILSGVKQLITMSGAVDFDYTIPIVDWRSPESLGLKSGPVTMRGLAGLYASRRCAGFHLYHPEDLDAGSMDGLSISSGFRKSQGHFLGEGEPQPHRDDDLESFRIELLADRDVRLGKFTVVPAREKK